jgi:hypothetical protein
MWDPDLWNWGWFQEAFVDMMMIILIVMFVNELFVER